MGIAALVVVIITVIAVTSGHIQQRLAVSDVNGNVVITDSNGNSEELAVGRVLMQSDIITVNDGACTLAYSAKDGADENFVMIAPLSQVFVSDEFDGRGEDELYLNRGSLIVNGLGAKKCGVKVRTDSSSVLTNGSVIRVAYDMTEADGEISASTNVASFGGASEIQLYNALGEKVDRNGNIGGAAEPMGTGLSAKVMSGDPPSFDYLNIPTVLADYDAVTLRDLITISSTGELSFTAAEIKEAYDALPAETEETETETETEPETETETTTDTTIETTVSETETEPETTEATTEPTTTTVTTTRPSETTVYTTTTPASTTIKAPETTASRDLISVYIIIGDEITEQQVPYGGNAIRPDDPYLDGKTFIGWDDSFENITEERTIIANFEDSAPVLTNSTESDLTFITEPDITLPITEQSTDFMFINDPNGGNAVFHNVTFIVDGMSYNVQVADGQNAVPPVVPPQVDSNGQNFLAWDQPLTNVTSDMTVFAVYG